MFDKHTDTQTAHSALQNIIHCHYISKLKRKSVMSIYAMLYNTIQKSYKRYPSKTVRRCWRDIAEDCEHCWLYFGTACNDCCDSRWWGCVHCATGCGAGTAASSQTVGHRYGKWRPLWCHCWLAPTLELEPPPGTVTRTSSATWAPKTWQKAWSPTLGL